MSYSRITTRNLIWLDLKETRLTQLYQSRAVQKGHRGRRCTDLNDAIKSKYFKIFLFGKCVQFSPLKGKLDFIENKVKFGVKIRSSLVGNSIFCLQN